MQAIQRELNKVDNWCKRWRLGPDTEKYDWLYIGDTLLKTKLTPNDNTLPKLTSVTNLGVRHPHGLNISEHNSTKKSKSLGLILRPFLQNEQKIILYKVCIRPIVDYRSFLLSNLRLANIPNLEGIQRDFTSEILKTDPHIEHSS